MDFGLSRFQTKASLTICIPISPSEMRQRFCDGDRVVAVSMSGKLDRRWRAQGELVEVLERGVREVAGQYIKERGVGLVIPDDSKLSHRILVAKGGAANAKHGEMVVVEILDYPTHIEQATGRITAIIGAPNEKGIATEIAIHSHGIPAEWPKKVVNEIEHLGTTVPSKAKQGRTDLRDVDLVTIDGADARDFDDAVYCEKAGNGWRLLVAIADVAHYVRLGSSLDKEAVRRGTSVYFPDRVVPMLPEVLSNGLCSLNPKVDRLCMVCDMRVSASGKVTRSTFVEGVMRSKARLTYSQVNDFLEGRSKHRCQSHCTGRFAICMIFIVHSQKRGLVAVLSKSTCRKPSSISTTTVKLTELRSFHGTMRIGLSKNA